MRFDVTVTVHVEGPSATYAESVVREALGNRELRMSFIDIHPVQPLRLSGTMKVIPMDQRFRIEYTEENTMRPKFRVGDRVRFRKDRPAKFPVAHLAYFENGVTVLTVVEISTKGDVRLSCGYWVDSERLELAPQEEG